MSRVISRDPDRLVFFTDAVVAIAITLLVLPLVEVVPEVANSHSSSEVFTEHRSQIFAFLLSFVVILRMWFVHHRVFQHIGGYTRALMLWNAGWILGIVVLPFPTEMVSYFSSHDRVTLVFYIGTVLVVSVCMAAVTVLAYRNTEVAKESDPPTSDAVRAAVATSGLFLVCLVVVAIVPRVSYYVLFLMFLQTWVEKLLRRAGL